MIEQNLLFIDTTGTRVGQVNGLSVLEIGGYAFGKPVRITASASPGKVGIINIEREANLSGRFHDKGVHIISGYMRRSSEDCSDCSATGQFGTVAFGHQVTFKRDDGKREAFGIVGKTKRIRNGSVSYVSPVARARNGQSRGRCCLGR